MLIVGSFFLFEYILFIYGGKSHFKNLLSLILFIICANPLAAQGPNPAEAWMLKELLRDSTLDATIIQLNQVTPEKYLFWPEDLKPNGLKPLDLQDNIVKNKDGFFMLLHGSGRVYRLQPESDQIRFIRIDSTIYDGYNFGSFSFSSEDTLYSLGGYGFWHSNGLLRYFNAWSGGWELTPLNQKVEVGFNAYFFHDKKYKTFYAVGPEKINHVNNGLKKSKPRPEENLLSVYALDLTRKDWMRLGSIPRKREISSARRFGDLPWGNLYFMGPVPHENTALLWDFKNNRIFKLHDAKKANAIATAIFGPINNHVLQAITYYHDSSLVVLNSQQKRYTFPLTLADFIDTGEQVYKPDSRFAIAPETVPWIGAASLILLFPLIGFIGFKFYERRNKPTNRNPFTSSEKSFVLLFAEQPDLRLTGEKIDEFLHVVTKSKNVQNQKRSTLIRSINTKYTSITNDAENLITTERLEFDRRMIQYGLHKEKFKHVEHFFSKE